jgi:hypothetical protein
VTPLRALNLLLAAVIGAAIVVAVVVLFGVSRHREFQVDEVEHLHAAYNLRDGRMIYRDFWQGHPPLLYAMLAPLTDARDPVATYERARILLAILLLATIALTAVCAARLGGVWAATLAAALALLHTTMIERGIEVRPDGPLALLIMAALAVELAPRAGALRRHSIEALLLGGGMLLTQKAILPLVPFGVLWAITARRERRLRLVLQPVLLAAVPLLVGWGVLAALGAGDTFVRYVFLNATSAATRSESRGTFSPAFFLLRESARNITFVAAAVGGLVSLIKRSAWFVVALAVVSVAALWVNPFPWPYVHVTFIPLLAVVAGAGVVAMTAPRWRGAAVVGVLTLAALIGFPRLMQKAAGSPDLQFATLREIDRVTPRGARCFDLVGLYFRPDAYPVYAMSGDMLVAYQHGTFPRIVPALRHNAVDCVMFNYRTEGMGAEEQQFVGAHFVHYWANIFLPGTDLSHGGVPAFEVLAPRAFRYDGAGAIAVDGTPFVRGTLLAGNHHIDVIRPSAPSRLIMDTPPPFPPPTAPRPLYPAFD